MRYKLNFCRCSRKVSRMIKCIIPSKEFIRMLPKICREEFNTKNFFFSHGIAEDFTRITWHETRKVSLSWLCYRFIVCLYFLSSLACGVGYRIDMEDYRKSLIYLTNWAFIVQSVTFSLGFTITVKKFLEERKAVNLQQPSHVSNDEESLSKVSVPLKLPATYQAFWALYCVSLPAAIVVSVIFWFFIYQAEHYPFVVRNFVMHGSNSLVLVADFAMVAFPYRFLHFYVSLIFGFSYGLFTYLYFLAGATAYHNVVPIYSALDWRTPGTALFFSFMCLVFTFFIHTLFCLLHHFKVWLQKPINIWG